MRKSLFGYLFFTSMMAMAGVMFVGSVLADDKPVTGAEVKIAILNYKFDPEVLTVAAGTTVTWVNQDETVHSVVSSDKRFTGSGGLDKGDEYSYTFTTPGSYEYFCSLHPFMKGKIVVTAVPATAPAKLEKSIFPIRPDGVRRTVVLPG